MELSSDLHQLTKGCILLILLTATVVNVSANEEGVKYFENEVKLLTIKNNALSIIKDYIEQKRNEVNEFFKKSAPNKFLINYINDIEIWWKKDVSQRSELILNKYAGNRFYTSDPNISIEDLELDLENGLITANEYWMKKIDQKISDLRKIPFKKIPLSAYFRINKPLQRMNNYEDLRLPTAELQLEYNKQMILIQNITNITKQIVDTKLANIQANELFDNSTTNFVSELLNTDRYKAVLREGMFGEMQLKERDAIDRLKKLWIINQFIPENIKFCNVALNQLEHNLKLINKTMHYIATDPQHSVALY